MKQSHSRIFAALSPKGLSKWLKHDRIGRTVERYLTVYLAFFFLFLFVLTLVIYQNIREVKYSRDEEIKRLSYWEQIVKKYPNYPDGYYKAAVSALRLRERGKANSYIDQAITLNPHFKEALQVKQELQKQGWF